MSISRPRRSASPASATCRATCSATACCSSARSGWSPLSIIATFSSIPNPDTAKTFAERQRLFNLPRSSWQDFDKSLISKGGGIFPRSAKEIPLSPEMQALLGPQGRARDAAAGDENRSCKCRSICSGSAASAPMCAPPTRPTRRPAIAPTTPIRVTGQRPQMQGDRRGRQSRHDPARPHRGRPCRRAAQHRRHRQFRRRQHLRRRGQYQDRGQRAGARRHHHARSAQCDPRRDDRRCRRARAAQQLQPDAGAVADATPRPRRSRLPAAADADAGGARPAQSRRGSFCPTTRRSPSAAAARSR